METSMFNVDFNQSEPQVICHPQYEKLIPEIKRGLKGYDLKDHFIIFSSGTTGGDLKGYALSKDALFANAKATNEHFDLSPNDVWGLSLPVYHVGGLSVLARAHLLRNKVVDIRKWNPERWIKDLESVTITTIVPTQLYDLVKRGYKSPMNLRYLIVGGDFLSSSLEDEAFKLGWPVIRTFGMTEVCSQLASSQIPKEELKILPIHQVKTDDQGTLLINSSALFTLQFVLSDKLQITSLKELSDVDGFYQANDRVIINGNSLKHLGRVGDEIKIAGHLVNLLNLKHQLSTFLYRNGLFNEMELLFETDERKGHKLVLLTLPQFEQLSREVSLLIHPVKIDEVRLIENFDRTALGKLKRRS
jgi:O-succinylbenzoic acid--CoA ligase